MKKIQKLLVAGLLVWGGNIFAQGVQYIGVFATYHSFQPGEKNANERTGEVGNMGLIVYLGDTVRFTKYFDYPTTVTDYRFHTITLTKDSIPSGANVMDENWDQNSVTHIDYIPTKLGRYRVKCIPHESMGMKTYFTVYPRNVVFGDDICSNGYSNGMDCYYKIPPFCFTCSSLGQIANCSCVALNMVSVLGCNNGLFNGSFCTLTVNGATFTGFTQNCACQSIGGNNMTSVCTNGLTLGNTCTGINAQNISFTGIVDECRCKAPCTNGLVNGFSCTGTNANNQTFTGYAANCQCSPTISTSIDQPNANELLEEKMNLFPNPANEYVNVPLRNYLKYNIYVYNIKGDEVLKQRAELEENIKLNIKHLPNGKYIVQTRYCICTVPKQGCQGANKSYTFVKE